MIGFRGTLAVLVAAGALTMLATPAQAGKFYKWVDEKGVTHYTEKAPKDAKSTTIKVGDTTSSDADDEIKALADKRIAASTAKEKAAEDSSTAASSKDEKERDQKLCDQHRKNLATLKSGNRILTKDAKGNQSYLTAEQVQQQLQVSETEVQRCDQQKIAPGAGATPSVSKNAP